MRSYIFTARERIILKKWLDGGARADGLDMILHRIRSFQNLERDIKLYLKVKESFKQVL